MSDEPISYTKLMTAYNLTQPIPHPIIRYEIDGEGVVHLYSADGAWRGMTSKAGLQYFLDNAPKDPA